MQDKSGNRCELDGCLHLHHHRLVTVLAGIGTNGAVIAHQRLEKDFVHGLVLPTLDAAVPHLLPDEHLPEDGLSHHLVGNEVILLPETIHVLIDLVHDLSLLRLPREGYQSVDHHIDTNPQGGGNAVECGRCRIPHLAGPQDQDQEAAAAPLQVMVQP